MGGAGGTLAPAAVAVVVLARLRQDQVSAVDHVGAILLRNSSQVCIGSAGWLEGHSAAMIAGVKRKRGGDVGEEICEDHRGEERADS